MSGDSSFPQKTVFRVVDEAADVFFVDDERAQMESAYVLQHALIRIAKGFERPPWSNTALGFDLMFELVLRDVLQSAVGVMNEHDFSGLHASLGHDERTDDVIGDHSARIAKDVGLAVGQTEQLEDVHAAVHARHDRHVAARHESKTAIGEGRREVPIEPEELFGIRVEGFRRRHGDILPHSNLVRSVCAPGSLGS